MNAALVIAGMIGLSLLVYLVYSIVRPEKF
jgi:K+-transporting ATPase KdpF subunit